MGVSYRGTCPYCHTEHVEFRAEFKWMNINSERRALFKCGYCGEGVIRGYAFEGGRGAGDILTMSGNVSSHRIDLGEQWPLAPRSDAPADCPSNIASFYKQGLSSLNSGSFDASGMMFRKALEAATIALDPALPAKTLAARVKALVTSNVLTPALGAWANEIRLGGNEAAHEEEPFSKADAEALHNFTENFLNYTFTMPAAVARRSSPTQP